MKVTMKVVAVVIAVVLVAGAITYLAVTSSAPANGETPGVIDVVAAENFWGSLITQLGGTHVSVTSIVSDPNADPHEYEANASDARAIANAQFVIENGEGYDDWCSQLVASAAASGQVVLNVQNTLGVSVGWQPSLLVQPYLCERDCGRDVLGPGRQARGTPPISNSNTPPSMSPWTDCMVGPPDRDHFHGQEVASTESIFVYLANWTDLNLRLSPRLHGSHHRRQ